MSERTTRNKKDSNSRHGVFSRQNGPDWPNVIPDRTLFGHIREQGKAASEAEPVWRTISVHQAFSRYGKPGVLTGFLPLSCLLGIIRN
ncbi:MAG: hypothetical protein ABF959_03445 [Gluconobacter albidus]|uniref:hypothetical protein n=1 Tax=Gluconobacter albidus TaxID=318683 RepID=UPI0011AED726|nr:hypothetical protein [Gluconobacter albidus]